MNLQSISSGSDLASVYATRGTSSASSVSGSGKCESGSDGQSGQSSSVSMSGPGKIFSQLQALEKSDPTKAKQVLSGIADKLRASAKDGDGDSDKLNALADKFQNAADTGDISSLKPPPPPPGGAGGPHHHARKAYSQGSGDEGSGNSIGSLLKQALASVTSDTSSVSSSSLAA